ncbi:hypothetical protein EDB89DRAFT_1912570 [Lactarius sanguifluus]|nr:hypothetical protein EDB89DRAFT_1912570 [Lactarius sanguifluus]
MPASMHEYEFAFFGARVLVYSQTYMTCLWASISLSESESARFVAQVATVIPAAVLAVRVAPPSRRGWSWLRRLGRRNRLIAVAVAGVVVVAALAGELVQLELEAASANLKHVVVVVIDARQARTMTTTRWTTTATQRRHDGKANSNNDDADDGNANNGDTNNGDANDSDVEMNTIGDGSDSDTTVVGDTATLGGICRAL